MKLRAALLLLALSAPALAQERYDPSLDPVRYDGCLRAIEADAAKVEQYAAEWQSLGGGLPARHCLALAQMHQGRNAAAERTLTEAATLAETTKSPMAADLWAQAGNAALLAGNVEGAVAHFSAGLAAAGEFAPRRSANLLIDRARARVEQTDLVGARQDLDLALARDPDISEGWLLSAALARRQQDLPRARADIEKATALAPQDADISFEKGNIEASAGDLEGARSAWRQAEQQGAGSDAAHLAAKALAENPQ